MRQHQNDDEESKELKRCPGDELWFAGFGWPARHVVGAAENCEARGENGYCEAQ